MARFCVRLLADAHPGLDHLIPVVQQPAAFFDKFKLRADAADVSDTDRQAFIAFVNGNLRKRLKSVGRTKEKVALADLGGLALRSGASCFALMEQSTWCRTRRQDRHLQCRR